MSSTKVSLEAQQVVQMKWLDLCYSVKDRKDEKLILHRVNGYASPGEVLAVMGSSGAGKTTLLNALSGRELAGNIGGVIEINGTPLRSRAGFRKLAAFITQDDLMMETLTPREIIDFSAALRLPRSVSVVQRKAVVAEIITKLHIERAADTIVGDPSRGGISGGERKRTNVGTELVTNPSVLFVDEPTSGLDAFTALKVMNILKDLAKEGRTIVTTIHQPASEIFMTFDRLMLMHRGGCAYFGPAGDALGYFRTLGLECPPNYNPADFFINVLMQQVYGELKGAPAFIDAWAKSDLFRTPMPLARGCELPVDVKADLVASANACVQFVWIARRNILNYKRDKLGMKARMAQTTFFSIIVGLIFYDLNFDQQSIQDRSGLIFFACLSQGFLAALQVVLMFPTERRVYEREHSSGFYSIFSYFMAKMISETPLQIVFATLFSSILYHLTGLSPGAEKFWIFCTAIVLVTNCAVSLGFVVGCAAPTPQVAVAMAPATLIPLVLVGGLLANKDRLDPYFLWLETISFFSYGYEAVMINEFSGIQFTFNQTIAVATPIVEMVTIEKTVEKTLPNGMVQSMTLEIPMPNITGFETSNQTQEITLDGEEILDTMGMDLGIKSCIIALVVWLVVARIVALLSLYVRAYGGRVLRGGQTRVLTLEKADQLRKLMASDVALGFSASAAGEEAA